MESNSSRRTMSFGAFALAAMFAALGAAAVAASWQWIGARARQDAAREAELDEWAHADPTPPTL